MANDPYDLILIGAGSAGLMADVTTDAFLNKYYWAVDLVALRPLKS